MSWGVRNTVKIDTIDLEGVRISKRMCENRWKFRSGVNNTCHKAVRKLYIKGRCLSRSNHFGSDITTDNQASILAMASPSYLADQIFQLDSKYRKSLQQIAHLNIQISDLQLSYKRACKAQSRRFCCNLTLRITFCESMREHLYEDAIDKCDRIEQLRNKLIEQLLSGGSEE